VTQLIRRLSLPVSPHGHPQKFTFPRASRYVKVNIDAIRGPAFRVLTLSRYCMTLVYFLSPLSASSCMIYYSSSVPGFFPLPRSSSSCRSQPVVNPCSPSFQFNDQPRSSFRFRVAVYCQTASFFRIFPTLLARYSPPDRFTKVHFPLPSVALSRIT